MFERHQQTWRVQKIYRNSASWEPFCDSSFHPFQPTDGPEHMIWQEKFNSIYAFTPIAHLLGPKNSLLPGTVFVLLWQHKGTISICVRGKRSYENLTILPRASRWWVISPSSVEILPLSPPPHQGSSKKHLRQQVGPGFQAAKGSM